MLFNYILFNLNNEIKYVASKFYFLFLENIINNILSSSKEKKERRKKNHSRQNANEPGSYYNANEIPPQKLLLQYPGYISSIFGKQLYIQNKGQISSAHSLTFFI